jgi:hypothetical protein
LINAPIFGGAVFRDEVAFSGFDLIYDSSRLIIGGGVGFIF